MSTPAGWYLDANGDQRYWDGARWTGDIVSATDARVPAAPTAPSATSGPPIATPPGYTPSGYANPGHAQPGHTPMPYQASFDKPRRRVWPWVLGIVGVVLVAIIGVVIWIVVALSGSIRAPFDTLNEFERAVESGDCAAMQETVTSSLLAERGWDDCEAFKADAASLVPSSFDANDSTTGPSDATVKADIYFAGDSTYYVGTYTLIQKDGKWRVNSFMIEPSGW
jgi:hypothetical protein